MNFKSREKLLASVAALSLLGISPQQTFAAQITTNQAVQQTKKITGNVSDAMGPIIGATVKVKGTKNAAVTDFDGNYTLNVGAGQTVEVSYVGYITKSFKVGGQNKYDLTLTEDNNSLQEVVVVGYGTMKKSDLAGASASMDEKTLKQTPITNVDQAFQGKISGVNAVQTSGQPGSAVAVSVRGIATINANSEPLYVVDGVIFNSQSNSGSSLGLGDKLGNGSHSAVSPLSLINPSDIVSMEVLKDASATAIYGAQGANGVVLITTKKGKAGEAKFTYTGSVAASRQNKRLDIMNLREFAEYYNDLVNQGEISKPDATYSDPSILGIGTNWQDAIFQTAWQQSHQISAEGGTDKVNYYISGNWTDQDGTIIGSEFQRYSMRVNLSAQLKKWFKLGLNATYSKTSESLKLADGSEGLINYSLTTPPDIQIYNINGGYSSVSKEGFTNPNPIALAMEDDILLDRQSLNGSVFADITLMKGLTWHSQLGFDIGASKADTYSPMIDLGTWKRQNNQSRLQKNSNTFWSLNNYLQYSTNIGKHSITAMLGQECWESKYDYLAFLNTQLPNDVVHNPALGQGDPKPNAGWGSSSMASFFTRETYNYDDRYLATYTYRYDGSSNFGPNNRWAGFHSLALAWRFTNEKFMKDIKWLSNGKLRLGWGQTGNANINSFAWGVNMQKVYTSLGSGYRPQNIPNLDVKWEKQEQIDLGIDLGFLNNRINLTLDWYQKESKDMLMEMQMPSYMGTSGNGNSKLKAPMGNYGHIRNSGLELTLNTHPLIGKFQWDSEFQISWNKNKLVALNGTASSAIMGYAQWEQTQVSKTDVGQSLYSFYGYVTDGIYQDLADIERSPKPEKYPTNGVFNGSNTVYVGDIKYKDLNGDGVINELDQTNIGSPMPKFTFGWTNTFRYKDFDLNIFINGSYGNKVMNLTKRGLTNMSSVWCNQHTDVLNRARLEPIDASIVYADGSKWYEHIENVRVANPNASLPRAIIGDPNDNDRISDRYVEDGSYLRMKNISLGYTFPKKWIGKWGIENLRVYCNIQNLFTITGYDGYDPEIGVSTMSPNVYGVDYGRYPSPTTYSFGLNMSF